MWNQIRTDAYEGMTAETVTMEGHNGAPIRAYFSRPLRDDPYPGIILIPHMPGWDEMNREVARRFTQYGYLALRPSIYERYGHGLPGEISAKVREAGGVSDDSVMGDCEGVLNYLIPYSNGRVGVIGMCSGGRHAFLAGCRIKGLDAVVDCWGGRVVAPKEELTPEQVNRHLAGRGRRRPPVAGARNPARPAVHGDLRGGGRAVGRLPRAVRLGHRMIQSIPIVRREADGKVTPGSVSGKKYGNFLCAVFDEWALNDLGRLDVQLFAETGRIRILAEGSAGLCWMPPVCGRALVVEQDGGGYSCDHYVTAGHRIGGIDASHLGELADSPTQRRFGENKCDGLPGQCRSCMWIAMCNGGCPKDRFTPSEDGEPGLNHLCSGLRHFFPTRSRR